MNEESQLYPLILASGSASRRELLNRLRLPFSVDPADIDEKELPGESPEDLVTRLAREKAAVIAGKNCSSVVIGSDQVALHAGLATSKPGTEARAREFLKAFSGQEVVFLTAVCVLQEATGYRDEFIDFTRVQFRALTDTEIRRYVELDDPLACAGGFKVESLGPTLFESVSSEDPTALPGLPLIQLCQSLRALGYALP